MDDGECVYAVLRDLYIAVFTLSAFNTATIQVNRIVFLYDDKLCDIYGRLWHCGTGGHIGQLAIQHIYIGRIDDSTGDVGNAVSARAMCPPKKLINFMLGFYCQTDYNSTRILISGKEHEKKIWFTQTAV